MSITFGDGGTVTTSEYNDAGLGFFRFGETRFGEGADGLHEQINVTKETDTNLQYVTPYGVGFYGGRIYSKPWIVTFAPSAQAASDGAYFLKFYNTSDTLMGVLAADVQRSIIQSVEWREDDRGVGDASVVLSKLPDFPIIPFGGIGIEFGRNNTKVYRGYVRVDDTKGTTKDKVTLVCNGLREQLKGITPNRVISGPDEVGDAVKDIFDTDILGQTDIKYNAGKLETVTGTTYASNLDFAKDKCDKVVDSLAKMANAEAGVDGSGEFFFQVKSDEVVKTYFVGYQVQEYEPSRDIEKVRNSIVVQRNQQDASGKAGWTVGDIANDTTSRGLYGFREKTVKAPGYFSDGDCAIIADNVLADRKDPKAYAKIKIPINSEDDLITRGNYNFVSALTTYESTITENDATTGWFIHTAGDLTMSIVSSPILSGSGALKLTWTNGNGDRAEYTPTAEITKATILRIYVRAAKRGSYLTFGWGESSWDENTTTIPIDVSNQYIQTDFPIPTGSTIGKIAIRIDTADSGTVYLDRLEAVVKDHKHQQMRMKKVHYRFTPNKLEATAEFGEPPSRMENFIEELLRVTEKNDSSSEER